KDGKRCLDVLYLLEDFLMHDPQQLFRPLDESLNISNHFSRLSHRINNLSNLIKHNKNFSEIISGYQKSFKGKKYIELYESQNEELVAFFDVIDKEIIKWRKNKNNIDLAQFWTAIQSCVSYDFAVISKRTGLLSQLLIDKSWAEKQEDKEIKKNWSIL